MITYQELIARRDHAALVRGDDGNIHIRRFSTPAAAAQASQDRELPEPSDDVKFSCRLRKREWRLTDAARHLGISDDTLRRYLPYLRHRRVSPKVTYIPGDELNLIKLHGLHGVRAQRSA